MDYKQAIEFLDSCINYERVHQPELMRRIKLDRMRRLCRWLGEPQRRFRSILVTGTNGKGSICEMIYSMLRESQLSVGLYTSPHIESPRERIRTWTNGPSLDERTSGDDWISNEDFAEVFTHLKPIIETMRDDSPQQAPSYFEIMTAAAFLHFQKNKVDVAVLEVGLGGRLDATNVVEQAVSVIGPIGMDHTDVLGDNIASIATEKAGIIKNSQTVISASQPAEVEEVLQAACDAQAVPMITCGREITIGVTRHEESGLEVSITGLRGIYQSLNMPLLGRHQGYNAALAVGAIESLSNQGVPYAMVERGLSQIECPCRIEIVHQSPLVIIDGAHNPHAARGVIATLEELWGQRPMHLLIGMSSDKAIEAIAKTLCPRAKTVTFTKSRHERSMEPADLAKKLGRLCEKVNVIPDIADAYTYLLNTVDSTDMILVTGSMFLTGELRASLKAAHINPSKREPVLN